MGRVKWTRTRWGLIPARYRSIWAASEAAVKKRWKLISEHHRAPDEDYYRGPMLTQRQLIYEEKIKRIQGLFSTHKPYFIEGKVAGWMRKDAQDLLQVTHWDQVLQYMKDSFSDKDVHSSVVGWFDQAGRWFAWSKPEYRYGKTSQNKRAPHGWRIGFRIHPMAMDLSDEVLCAEAFALKNIVPVPRCMSGLWRPDREELR